MRTGPWILILMSDGPRSGRRGAELGGRPGRTPKPVASGAGDRSGPYRRARGRVA